MSALGQKRTFGPFIAMSAFPPKADIVTLASASYRAAAQASGADGGVVIDPLVPTRFVCS
jgi:hypothetical protein